MPTILTKAIDSMQANILFIISSTTENKEEKEEPGKIIYDV